MSALAEIVGDSVGIRRLREQLEQILRRAATAPRPPSILIRGETGTGKGLLARTLHRAGARAHAPFVDVNCAAIPENLLEAELFGYERGAFTDARQAKPGLFQLAHHGTLFLDEIGLLTPALQAKLLKNHRVRPRLRAIRALPGPAAPFHESCSSIAAPGSRCSAPAISTTSRPKRWCGRPSNGEYRS